MSTATKTKPQVAVMNAVHDLPVLVARDQGFFKDEGLEVLFVMFNAGATNLQALIGGDVQIMGSAFVETIGGRAAGIDVKNFWGVSNLMPFQLYSQPDFKSMKQAKGKGGKPTALGEDRSVPPRLRSTGGTRRPALGAPAFAFADELANQLDAVEPLSQ